MVIVVLQEYKALERVLKVSTTDLRGLESSRFWTFETGSQGGAFPSTYPLHSPIRVPLEMLYPPWSGTGDISKN